MKTLIILMAALLSLQVHAQRRGGTSVTGNGGDVVDCGPKEPLLLLDVYEMTVIQRRKMITENFKGDANHKISELLKIIARQSPYQARLLEKEIEQFKKNRTMTTEELEDIPDSKHVFLDEDCKVRQIVIQYRENGVSQYKINSELLARLDEDNLAALAFHEAVYADAIDLRHENSIPTRAYNIHLLAGKVADFNEVRTQFGFYAIKELANGDAFFLKPFQYERFRKNEDRAYKLNQYAFVCGISLQSLTKLHLPCSQDFLIRYDANEIIAMEESSSTPWGKYKDLFNTPYELKAINFKESTISARSGPSGFNFGGLRYFCNSESIQIPLLDPGKTESQNIQACLISGDSSSLFRPATKFSQRLPLGHYSYKLTFLRKNGQPAGVRFDPRPYYDKKQEWNFAFTHRENLTFNSYEENWIDNQITLRGLSGVIRYPDKNGKLVTCNISDIAVFDMSKSFPELMQGPGYKNQNCPK